MVAQNERPTGPRASRGGVAARKSGHGTDLDGDVRMGAGAGAARRGGGITKGGKPKTTTRTNTGKPARAPRTEKVEQAMLKQAKSANTTTSRSPEELRISGWKSSKAATTSSDEGRNSLIAWLEKKATLRNGPSKRAVKVKKSRTEADDLIITVEGQDAVSVLRLDGYVFAGVNIRIVRNSASDLTAPTTGATKESTMDMLKNVLSRRYNVETKVLDLSALGTDPDLHASQIFDSTSTATKFFPALMKVLETQFASNKALNDAIHSVSLAGNKLENLAVVSTLAPTLPNLKHLDLSNNDFKTLSALDQWRRKFRNLDLLVLTSNPIEQNEPDYLSKIINWYPKLRHLNGIQVRSDEDIAKRVHISDLPFPIRPACFQDDNRIAETFLTNFFTGYDNDRNALAQYYYDANSNFSFAVNTHAPRDPSAPAMQAQEWDAYIKGSRNLKKLSHPPARQSRSHRGAQAIAASWATLPTTKHPDLASEARKWIVECQVLPGVPDATGTNNGGVDGFLITVHGEFNEIDVSTNNVTKTRSFDRVFTLGPGAGPSGIRVVNDMLTVRAYGGIQAFEPDADVPQVHMAAAVPATQQEQQPVPNIAAATTQEQQPLPGMPPGLTQEIAEQMVLELSNQTGMVVGYAKLCLDQTQWDFPAALQAFATVRPTLPADAFVAQSV